MSTYTFYLHCYQSLCKITEKLLKLIRFFTNYTINKTKKNPSYF